MLSRIFPRQFDNAYRGHWLAIWLLALVAGVKGMQGVVSVIDTRNTLIGADAIPLDTYGVAAQNTAVAIGALLGLHLALVALVVPVVALIRYRTMIPLMYLLLLASELGSRILLGLHPIARTANPEMGFAGHSVGFYVNLVIVALTVVGFVLSLMPRNPGAARAQTAP